jgi:hypothetical protein
MFSNYELPISYQNRRETKTVVIQTKTDEKTGMEYGLFDTEDEAAVLILKEMQGRVIAETRLQHAWMMDILKASKNRHEQQKKRSLELEQMKIRHDFYMKRRISKNKK